MAADIPKILVVIVNWERPADTKDCLESIYAARIEGLACLVVDNGSLDNSIKEITVAYPRTEILALPHNLGFAGGYNAGIRRALETGAPKIFLLNNDTIVDPRAVPALAQTPWDVAIPKITYHSQPEKVWCAGCTWRAFPPSVTMIGYGKPAISPELNRPYPLDYATGCAMMVNREVLLVLGGFDEDFPSYMEDYDFSFRLRQRGFTMGYVPEAVVEHKVSQSLGEYTPRRWRLMGHSAVLFYRKENRFPGWNLWIFIAWVVLRETLRGRLQVGSAFIEGAREGLAALPGSHRNDAIR